MKTTEPARFFILGCQRSGTTLMRLALESHPAIACLDETRSYGHLASEDPDPAPPGVERIGFKIPRWTESLGAVGGDLPARPFYAGEPAVFLVRDVRDVVASMRSLRLGGTDWLTEWGVPLLEARIARDRPFRKRYAREIARLRSRGGHLAAAGALYWKGKTEALMDYQERGLPILGVGYEDLVHDPEARLRAVVEALGLDWHPATLEHASSPHEELFPDGTTVGGTDPRRPIDASSVGLWRSRLTPEDVAIVLEIAGDLLEEVSAVLPGDPARVAAAS